jgi:hypothetical protein
LLLLWLLLLLLLFPTLFLTNCCHAPWGADDVSGSPRLARNGGETATAALTRFLMALDRDRDGRVTPADLLVALH